MEEKINLKGHERYNEMCREPLMFFTDKSLTILKEIQNKNNVEENIFNLIDRIELKKSKEQESRSKSIIYFRNLLMDLYLNYSVIDFNRDFPKESHRIIHESVIEQYTIFCNYFYNHLVRNLCYHSKDYSNILGRNKTTLISKEIPGSNKYQKLENEIIDDLKGADWEINCSFLTQYDKTDRYYGIKPGSMNYHNNSEDYGSDGEGEDNNFKNRYKGLQDKFRSIEFTPYTLTRKDLIADREAAIESIQRKLNMYDTKPNVEFVLLTNISEENILHSSVKERYEWDSEKLAFMNPLWNNNIFVIGKHYFDIKKVFDSPVYWEEFQNLIEEN